MKRFIQGEDRTRVTLHTGMPCRFPSQRQVKGRRGWFHRQTRLEALALEGVDPAATGLRLAIQRAW